MPNQEQSKDSVARKARAGAGEPERPRKVEQPNERRGDAYRRDGPSKERPTIDEQPDLVSRSGVNERDHGAANDEPMGGGSVNLDDDLLHPRGKSTGPSDSDKRGE